MVPAPALLWLIGSVLFPLAAATGFLQVPPSIAWLVAAALAVAALADAWGSRQLLTVLRVTLPRELRAYRQRPAILTLRWESPTPFRQLRAGIAWPESFANAADEQSLALNAGVSELNWAFTPTRRGEYRLSGIHVEARSRLGLWDLRRVIPVDSAIRVHPNLRATDGLKALRQQQGQRALRQIGKGREFEKLREYVPGDSIDEIHWKATARRNQPITKVFQIERTQEVYVIVDASRLSARLVDGDPALDRALESALLLGLAAERHGDLFGLATFSDRIHGFVRARNGKAHYAACRDAIYRLEAQPVPADFDELFTFLDARLRRRALLVILTSLDDPALAESFTRASRLLARRHLVVAAMIQPPGTAPLLSEPAATDDDVYQQLGGHLAWRSLRELELALERQGVRFRQFTPRDLNQGLVALYDEIKQRQLL